MLAAFFIFAIEIAIEIKKSITQSVFCCISKQCRLLKIQSKLCYGRKRGIVPCVVAFRVLLGGGTIGRNASLAFLACSLKT